MNELASVPLSEDLKSEFGSLLLLDRLMRFDNLRREREELEKTLATLEADLKERKKGFFHSDEEEYAIETLKEDLRQARQALNEVEEEQKQQEGNRLNVALAERDESGLEPLVKEMERRGWLEIGEDNFFKVTEKGAEVYQHLLTQQQSYIAHFDVYAFVDLTEGVFADPENDLLEGDRWNDLRVAVAEHKGIDPYRVVFLSMLASEAFFEDPDWKFNLAMGTLFDEMETLTQEQIRVADLGFEDEEGVVSGTDVIEDIIAQGSEIAQARAQEQRQRQIQFETPDEQIITTTYYW